MESRAKRHLLTTRRAFLSILFFLIALLGCIAALAYWGYQSLDALLAPLLGATAWTGVQNILVALALDLSPYAAGLLAGALLLAWLLSRWATHPLNRLVAAITARDGATRDLPVRAAGEIGQVARRFDELAKSLRRTSEEKEEQSRSSSEALRQLEG